MTKLQEILDENNMTQSQLIELIQLKTGKKFGKDRISLICSGKVVNYSLSTAMTISTAIGIPMDEFVETKELNKIG